MSYLLYILENEVQLAALAFLAVVYTARLVWLFRFRPARERTYPAGDARAGIAFSMMNVAMPWAMESTRRRPDFYAQFVVFHLGVVAAIGATFIIPYWPELFESIMVVRIFQVILGAAFLVGMWRLYRRIFNPRMRLISSLDDYSSLILMILYFALGLVAVPNDHHQKEWPLILFFGLTAFFLVYVPFSKICHYLYYPFTRYFLGRTLGHRGVLAKKKRL
jgi:MFS family permease